MLTTEQIELAIKPIRWNEFQTNDFHNNLICCGTCQLGFIRIDWHEYNQAWEMKFQHATGVIIECFDNLQDARINAEKEYKQIIMRCFNVEQ